MEKTIRQDLYGCLQAHFLFWNDVVVGLVPMHADALLMQVPAQNETSGRSSGAASPNETKNDNLNVVVNSYQSHSAPVSPRRANRSDHGNSPVPHLVNRLIPSS